MPRYQEKASYFCAGNRRRCAANAVDRLNLVGWQKCRPTNQPLGSSFEEEVRTLSLLDVLIRPIGAPRALLKGVMRPS